MIIKTYEPMRLGPPDIGIAPWTIAAVTGCNICVEEEILPAFLCLKLSKRTTKPSEALKQRNHHGC